MKKIFYYILLLMVSTGCIQKFEPSIPSPATGYLVVEGIINSGGGPATVTLSRTTILADSSMLHETGASVQVEGNDNSVYPFSEQGNGVYGTNQLLLSNAQQYRIDIKTKDGKQYLSDYSPAKTCPPIDSLNWGTTINGVQVYVNTHDPTNNTIYYEWNYEETWEFHSHYYSDLKYDTTSYINNQPQLNVQLLPDANYSIYTCWKSSASSIIVIGSSVKLSSDIISNFPFSLIPNGSDKLSVEYSVLVNQYGLTADEYNFLQLMKQNTEETGSIFSSQPSQLQGNVHCVQNPAEIVIGYVGFSSVQSKRIFIYNSQLTNWSSDDNLGCTESQFNNTPFAVSVAFSSSLLPTTPLSFDFLTGAVTSFKASQPQCVDCRYLGTNQKPAFWQ
jgi:hypothetical protein